MAYYTTNYLDLSTRISENNIKINYITLTIHTIIGIVNTIFLLYHIFIIFSRIFIYKDQLCYNISNGGSMKKLIKFISTITGLFRSLVTILFLLAIAFTILVDIDLLYASFDIIGINFIPKTLIKASLIMVFAIFFILNVIITRHIFRAADNGKYHLSNLLFALIFLALDGFVYISLRNEQKYFVYVFFALNGLIVINSIFGLIAKARGLYVDDENNEITDESLGENKKENDYIEFEKNIDLDEAEANEEEEKVKIYTKDENEEKNSDLETKTEDQAFVDSAKLIEDSDTHEEIDDKLVYQSNPNEIDSENLDDVDVSDAVQKDDTEKIDQ